ncbi:MAG: thiamine phosphate synthase [Desulfobacteraceae bacterium]|jgi:thiamine-phosphate pyrophosphorylase
MTTQQNYVKPILPSGIYGMTARKFSRGRSNIDVVQQMIAGGAKIIQYREKRPQTSHRVMLDECRQLRALTREHDVLFIVNDHVDIAMLTDADGVHVGQDDLPVDQVRKLVGPNKIIGLSTHSPQQAQEAMDLGADYIGVGPIFSTRTKDDVCDPVGLEYLAYAVKNVTIPFVAIGGIKTNNIEQVSRLGAKTICLVTEIVGADDIAAMTRTLLAQMVSSQT